jgi:hypothetical protein
MQRFPKSLLAAALMLASASALAADVAPTAAPASLTPVAANEVNPFTGTALSVELAQQHLELAKLRTQIKQEEVALKNAETDMAQLPKKREADLKKTLAAASSGMGGYPGMPAVSLAGRKPVKQKASVPVAVAKPVAKPAPRMEVLGVSDTFGERQALLSYGDNVMTARSGDSTPLGKVMVLNDTQVSVGDATYTMRTSNLSRQVVPVPPAAAGAGAPRSPAAGSAQRQLPALTAGGYMGMSQGIPGSRSQIMPPGLSAE